MTFQDHRKNMDQEHSITARGSAPRIINVRIGGGLGGVTWSNALLRESNFYLLASTVQQLCQVVIQPLIENLQ